MKPIGECKVTHMALSRVPRARTGVVVLEIDEETKKEWYKLRQLRETDKKD